MSLLKKIIWVTGVLRRTVVYDWRFDNLCGSHLRGQVIVLVSWKFNWLENFQLSKTVSCLWRWLPHRLSKRQSQTTVLLRISITQIICFTQGMLLLGSNHFLIENNVTENPEPKVFLFWWIKIVTWKCLSVWATVSFLYKKSQPFSFSDNARRYLLWLLERNFIFFSTLWIFVSLLVNDQKT